MNTHIQPDCKPRFMWRNLTAFGVGALFAVGLGLSGMTQPEKIVGFLDFFGDWDPALLGVMGGGVLVNLILHPFITRKMKRPLFEGRFGIPTRRDIDIKLILGAVLFGAGWGLGGYCPGPGITAAVTGATPVIIFLGFMVVGMLAEKGISDRLFK
jgi:uncharacterized membrane protein YedE/YeeE